MDVWWIDEPVILGSSNPTTSDLEELRGQGFEVVVSLLREQEQPPNYDVARAVALGYERHNIPVRDFYPPSVAQLREFVDFVSGLGSRKVIVHCQGGVGRTGTFAAAYRIAKGLAVAEAIGTIRQVRPHAVETPEQVAALVEFAKTCQADASAEANGSA